MAQLGLRVRGPIQVELESQGESVSFSGGASPNLLQKTQKSSQISIFGPEFP